VNVISIGDVLDWTVEDTLEAEHNIYVVRAPEYECVLYVGKTKRWISVRIMEHLGQGWRVGGYPSGADILGHTIISKLPKSREWVVECYTTAEILGDHSQSCLSSDYLIDRAELEMINRMKPCLNVSNNGHGAELPDDLFLPVSLDYSTMILDALGVKG